MSLTPAANLNHLGTALCDVLTEVCRLVAGAGGRAWLVGGSVRDLALNHRVEDLDLEVFGLAAEPLQDCLGRHFEIDLVGQSFGILKLRKWPLDVGLPRWETKTGLGHRGFTVHSDPSMSLPDAAARRDFTINAMYLDPLTGETADPWAGLADLAAGVLRHTSDAFGDDPLRVLRGMQFAARFDLKAAPDTVKLCRSIEPEGLPGERIWTEWEKLLLLGEQPSRGLKFLRASDWLRHFPELAALCGCQQDPRYHPEGDVWTHTLHCLDVFARERVGDPWEDLVVGCAVLCHDLGKPATTTTAEDGRIRALGHEEDSVCLTEKFLGRMTSNRQLLAEVRPLVAEHMRPRQLYQSQASAAAVRRLAARVGRIDRLVRVARADVLGRPPLPAAGFPAGDWLLAEAEQLTVVRAPQLPLVCGRDLIALGLVPGVGFREILAQIYEAQMDGTITTHAEGMALAKKISRQSGD